MNTNTQPEHARYVERANLPEAFFASAAKGGDTPLLYEKIDGDWKAHSWRQIDDEVRRLARVLVECGIEAGDRVMITSENRPQWAVADLAIMSIGAIVVPTYVTNTENDHHFIMDHSGASLVITSGGRLATRVALAAARVPSLHTLIAMDSAFKPPAGDGLKTLHWANAVGKAGPLDGIDDRVKALKSDDVCCFIYTSGTGGRPKGVMLTHRSIQANINAAIELLDEGNVVKEQRFLSLLPLSHSYEHTAGLHLPIQIFAEIWYCEGTEHIAGNLLEASPTLMTAVPRLYEVLHERITRGVNTKGGLSRKLFLAAVAIGTKRLNGERIRLHERVLDRFLDRTVRAKVRARFGGRLEYFVSGGAALNPEIGRFFMALGVKLLQGYGQTEASPLISVNRPGGIRIETVGPAVAGVDVRIAKDGEILARGDMLMKGYWRDEAATAAVIRDGWLCTGDLGKVDADGYIHITGRKRDIIVNSGGDNIAPGRVEAMLTIEPEIEQAMVDGDRRPWLAAVVVPSAELLSVESSPENLHAVIEKAVERANSRLSQIENVRRFIIADEAFTTENGQMTATLKVRRHVVREVYGDRVADLYPRK